jgi:hypothetical protein
VPGRRPGPQGLGAPRPTEAGAAVRGRWLSCGGLSRVLTVVKRRDLETLRVSSRPSLLVVLVSAETVMGPWWGVALGAAS